KLSAGAPRNGIVAYTTAGDKVKVTVDGVDAEGKATHNEWTGQFDGKEYPVTGDATSDVRSYKKIDATQLEFPGRGVPPRGPRAPWRRGEQDAGGGPRAAPP